MSKQTINIGTVPNDGNGDKLRDAMTKVNENFTEVYSVLSPNTTSNNATVANSLTVTNILTVSNVVLISNSANAASYRIGSNLIANSTGLYHTGTINSASISVGSNTFVANGSGVFFTGSINAASYTAGNTTTGTGGFLANTTTVIVGNNTINSSLSSSGLNVLGTAVIANSTGVWTTGRINAASFAVGTFTANSSGVFYTGSVNAVSYTVGGDFVANVSGVFVTGVVNAVQHMIGSTYVANTTGVYHTGVVNAASHTVSTNFIANSTGVFTGVVNATSHTTGSSFIANSTGVFHTGRVNAASHSSGNVTTGTGGFIANTTLLYVGNNTINTRITSAGLIVNGTAVIANSSGVYTTGVVNAASYATGNVTTGTGGFSVNTTMLILGNNTINTEMTSSEFNINGTTFIANTTGIYHTGTINAASHTVGANFIANSTAVTIASNTLTLGTSTNGANGFTYLPNGFKLNWGWVSANSSAGNVTFTSAYTTNAYVVTATSNTTTATYQAGVISVNNTVAAIRTANITSTNVFWQAIGI
jgi:ribosomal protein S8E